ncbi:MAG: glycosyltransferase [Leptospira sp.]|jgi:glycosyltransferase involved in cell wall biosynthesis|nr:MAG: glycosyltransferase [Leptospira sp.]
MNYILKPKKYPKLLSIIIPCYNEENSLPYFQKEISSTLESLKCKVELIFINDGSKDNTLKVLMNLASKNKSIKVISFSRNFGHQMAVTAGLDFAKGDAIVIIDADLQDPPEVILEMIKKYEEGYDVVYGKRTEREGESFFKLASAWIFYRAMRKFIHKNLPVDSGDFRLISSKCLHRINQLREKHRFLRGMFVWIGLPQTAVEYKRSPRVAGVTNYPLSKMLSLAANAAISFSPLPLRFSLFVGIIVAFLGFAIGIYAVYRKLEHFFFDHSIVYNPGWATIVGLICLTGGFILISIGILGEYVARIYEEIKDRPLYIIDYTINISEYKNS